MNRHDPSPGTLAPAPPGAIDDARVAHEQRDRVIAAVVTILPLLGLAYRSGPISRTRRRTGA